ncbi:MAG: GGDEF domain-containing protein [Aquabacterium sp.]|jgi:diguanylate cyclase (GGDEF)-like protein|uniref:GGDEF domain-containing protein n=1 Tax=Aquabacterium sp. TaxID=1872578 RepID=UPI002A367551|nr:GGDEF domain-containing protein [Aquabacterium sp.]MDX9844628.1 GGDEF domain-containing protein [Aquabacterium sp.]
MTRSFPTPEHPGSGAVAMQVRADRLQLLFRQSFLATFGSVGGALALSWLQHDLGNQRVIAPWLITLCLAGMVRLGLFWAYHRSTPLHRTPARWEGVYWATLVFTAGAWGIGAFLLMSRDNLLSQVITLFFAIGMAGSAISAYSAYRSMTLAAVGLVLLPTTLWLLTEPGGEQRLLAFTTLAFSIFVVRATRELSEALQSLLRLRRELEIEHRIASNAARTDELTGLNNLRAFKEQADTVFAYTRRYGLPLCALLVDIDHFKQINDTHGHAAGDRVLQAVAQRLKTALREADLCGRLGGEEFGVLLAGTDLHEAQQIAEKLRLAIQAIVVPMNDTTLHVTISVGVAEAGLACPDTTTLLAQADAAMYQAKSNGRNRVHRGHA